jgi:hypothetical protein
MKSFSSLLGVVITLLAIGLTPGDRLLAASSSPDVSSAPETVKSTSCQDVFHADAMPLTPPPATTLSSQDDVIANDSQTTGILRGRSESADTWRYCSGPCSNGLVGGAELLFIRPYFADGFVQDGLFGFEAAPRFWLGYKMPSGLGMRVRYWNFDNRGGNEEEGDYRLDTNVFDLELTDSISLGHDWDLSLSGGWRYVDFRFVYEDAINSEANLASSNGVTVAFELHRRLQHGLAIYGGFRASWLFGTLSYEAPWLEQGRMNWNDATETITETQLGVEWARSLKQWPAELMVRTGVEAQWWNSFATNMSAPQIGFFGYSLMVGIRR